MKKNIDYYPHKTESHRHPKFRMLRSIYGNSTKGWAAEGRFWALNNLIAASEDCKIDLSKKRNMGVYADELGMSIEEFSAFISILSGEDVELLTEIEPGVYTTDAVQETYQSVMEERKRAKKKYERSKKTPQNETSEDKDNFSTENLETSAEKLYKVNGSEVNKREWNKKEVNKSELTFFVKKLFLQNTKISDPNFHTHVVPVLNFLTQIPEALTKEQVENCITEAFEELPKNKGIRIDFLCNNIQRKITAKTEENLAIIKRKELKEAEIERKKAEKIDMERERTIELETLRIYRNFYEKNPDKFSDYEKHELQRFFKENRLIQAEQIILPKIETEALI